MRFANRSLTHRGSKRRLRSIKVRNSWSWDMTVLVIIVLSALVFILYRVVTNPPQH